MTSDRTRELVLPLAILASVVAGALLGNLFARTEENPTASAASHGDSKELVDVLQGLREEIALLREARTARSMAPPASERIEVSSTGATPKGDLAQALQAATAQLTTAVETLQRAVERPGGDRDRLIIRNITPDPQILDELGARPMETKQEYFLWTPQQILDKFGKPDRIVLSERGPSWVYRGSGKYWVQFYFQEGLVADVGSGPK
jgi:hypothetical protein